MRKRERGRQVVRHNELNEAKQIISECMSQVLFLYSWQVLPFHEPGQNAHREYQLYLRIWKEEFPGREMWDVQQLEADRSLHRLLLGRSP